MSSGGSVGVDHKKFCLVVSVSVNPACAAVRRKVSIGAPWRDVRAANLCTVERPGLAWPRQSDVYHIDRSAGGGGDGGGGGGGGGGGAGV